MGANVLEWAHDYSSHGAQNVSSPADARIALSVADAWGRDDGLALSNHGDGVDGGTL